MSSSELRDLRKALSGSLCNPVFDVFLGEASNGKHVTNMDTVRNLEWASSTCTLSFNTLGGSRQSC